nr:hypothetical protein GCM10025699_54020 [Microbacterium flavescens]
MHVRIINPNTSSSMTRSIGVAARAAASPSTVVTAVEPSMGPASIESHFEEALAVPGLLERISEGERDGVDAYVIACFGDPGLDAARELASGPVIGIAEAAFHAASFVARRFGVVTTLERTTGRARELVDRYGFRPACTEVRACEIAVLDLDDPASEARRVVADECRAVLAGERRPSSSAARGWPICATTCPPSSACRSSTGSGRRPPSPNPSCVSGCAPAREGVRAAAGEGDHGPAATVLAGRRVGLTRGGHVR